MIDFQRSRAELNYQLRTDLVGIDNYWSELQQARRRVALAADEIQRRAAAGALGGLVKRWDAFVIATLTADILGDARPGRERVRDWQRATFGKSCASSALARYAQEARTGGGRGEAVTVPQPIEQQTVALFQQYAQRFRDLP